jgi:uncharacterized protein
VAGRIYWYVPVRWLMLDQFRSLDIIQRVRAPILILHGADDQVIPFTMGQQLYEAATEPKWFVRLEGGNHAKNLENGGLEAVKEFLGAVEAKLPVQAPDTSAKLPPPP